MGFPIVFPINKANPMAVSLVFPKKHVGFSQLYPSSSIFQGVPSPWFPIPRSMAFFSYDNSNFLQDEAVILENTILCSQEIPSGYLT
jgi:hypothetical protein